MNESGVKQRLIVRNALEARLMKVGFEHLIHIGELSEIWAIETDKLKECE